MDKALERRVFLKGNNQAVHRNVIEHDHPDYDGQCQNQQISLLPDPASEPVLGGYAAHGPTSFPAVWVHLSIGLL
ncbi:hypothetical protein D3C80_1620050 [compost metagenome]